MKSFQKNNVFHIQNTPVFITYYKSTQYFSKKVYIPIDKALKMLYLYHITITKKTIKRTGNVSRKIMKTLNNDFKFNDIHADTLPFQSLELKKKIDYYNNQIKSHFDEMEDFEVNEYVQCYKDNIILLKENIKTMMNNESAFNKLLSCYNITTTIFCAKYLTDSVFDLTRKYTGTEIEANCIKYSKNLETEHKLFKVGDVIEFWAGYYNDIRYKSKIIGFGKSNHEQIENNEIYLLWECWWSPIKNDSNRKIIKIN